MPIDEDFYKKLKPLNKHNSHLVWTPGKVGEAAKDKYIKETYQNASLTIDQLGIHGTYVAVDWDDCIGRRSCYWICSKERMIESQCSICKNESCEISGACIAICPTDVFQWSRDHLTPEHSEIPLFMDKSDPVKESECIFCMACVTACPTKAIKVDESLLNIHNTIYQDATDNR